MLCVNSSCIICWCEKCFLGKHWAPRCQLRYLTMHSPCASLSSHNLPILQWLIPTQLSCHKALVISNFFLQLNNEFSVFQWPPQQPDLNIKEGLLEFGTMEHSQEHSAGCAVYKSAAIMGCNHVNMIQNLKDIFPTCLIHAVKNWSCSMSGVLATLQEYSIYSTLQILYVLWHIEQSSACSSCPVHY